MHHPDLEALYGSHNNGKNTPSEDDLKSNLQQTIKSKTRIYLVIDALDECTEQVLLMEFIAEIISWEIPVLRILATSRQEQDIEDGISETDALRPNFISLESPILNNENL